MLPTRQIFNSNTQQIEEATMRLDQNNEIVATFADGSFLKFPTTLTQTTPANPEVEGSEDVIETRQITPEDLNNLIDKHEAANTGQEVITPEMEQAVAESRQAGLLAMGVDVNDAAAVAAATAPIEPTEPESVEQPVINGNTMPEEDKTNAPTNNPDNPGTTDLAF